MTPSEFLDRLAAARAGIDQMTAFAPELARLLYAHYASLVEAGFSKGHALSLTETYLALILEERDEQE